MAKKMNRRSFLKLTSVGTCGAAVHQVLSPLHSMLAFADPLNPNPKVLLIVNFAGGVSHNISPLYHGPYRDKNPTVSFDPTESIPLNAEQGLHPSLVAFKSAWDEGRLAVVNQVGYPNPNRSHDESTKIWHSGLRNSSAAAYGGWGARLACAMNDSIFNGVSLSGANTLIQGGCNQPRSLGDLDNFGERGFWGDSGTTWLRNTREELIALADTAVSANTQYVRESALNLSRSVELIRQQTNITLPTTFPNTDFGRRCQDAAKIIASSVLRTRLVYLEQGGYDTHSEERPRLTELLNEVNGGIAALVECMKALGRWQDVTIITMSEFGRTFENASQGTDHGHSNPMFVLGGSVAGGIKSEHPSASYTQAAEDYFHSYLVDFREPFRLAVSHLGYDPNVVFPEGIVPRNISLYG